MNADRIVKNGRGFTLVEMFIVLFVLAIMAVIIIPAVPVASMDARVAVALRITRLIQGKISHHHAQNGQYPEEIPAEWFSSAKLPAYPFDPEYHRTYPDLPLIQLYKDVNDMNRVYPTHKTADDWGMYWYNVFNGHFRVRVPRQENNAKTLALFNRANGTACTSLGQGDY